MELDFYSHFNEFLNRVKYCAICEKFFGSSEYVLLQAQNSVTQKRKHLQKFRKKLKLIFPVSIILRLIPFGIPNETQHTHL
jgi:hypothetical protein